jgi:SWI/SNF-related matrix-associated actin-dependent regulator 1 of chromatin subfamily A
MIRTYASLLQNDSQIMIKTTFDTYLDLDTLYKIQKIPFANFYPQIESYAVPFSVNNLEQLEKWGFLIDEKLWSVLNDHKAKKDIENIPGLNGTLRPFQKTGVNFLENKNGRGLIADDMGIGKTIQSLAYLQLHRSKIPVVIVVPSGLKLNWLKEAEKWLPDPNMEILSGIVPYDTFGDILVINYDILPKWINKLMQRKPKILILDEAHYFKNAQAKRSKAVMRLGKNIEHIIGLTGTPIENRPIEIYNICHLLEPTLFPNANHFKRKYCIKKANRDRFSFNDKVHATELNYILNSTIMLRRKKEDVLTELPEKVFSFVPMELNNETEYREAEKNFIEWYRKIKGDEAALRIKNMEALVKIEGLKQLCVKGKMDNCIAWIRTFVDADTKLVIFTMHKFVIATLLDEFKDVIVKIDGSQTTRMKQDAVDRFQNDSTIKLLVGNIRAASEGHNLTAASNVVFIELPWSPEKIKQAYSRCDRMGQKFSVNINFLLANNTIEERIAKLIDSKKINIDAVVDNEDTPDENLLTELMKTYI